RGSLSPASRIIMADISRFRLPDVLVLVVVLATAAGARAWYLTSCADNGRKAGPLIVQGPPARIPQGEVRIAEQKQDSDVDALAEKLVKEQRFAGVAPLADQEEQTAHRAP